MSPPERLYGSAPVKRRMGSPVLWGFVQAFLAAGFYFSLGLVAARAHGWTWAVYAAAALFFVLTALSYVEGASLHQERGGVTIMARYAFNELWSFVAGWAILLDYLLLIALTALAMSNHLGVLWHPLGSGTTGFLVTVAPPRSWCSDAPSTYDSIVMTKNTAAAA